MSKYSLWLEPEGNAAHHLREEIEKLSKRHNTPLFEPHVTLVGKLTHGKNELIQLTDMLGNSLHSFELFLTRVGCGNSFYQSIFIHVEKSMGLRSAHRLACSLFDVDTAGDYLPHLSLLYGEMSRSRKERILNGMKREYRMRFTANFVRLVKTEGKPEDWKGIHSAAFR